MHRWRYSALKACHVAWHNRPNRSQWTLHTTRGVNTEMIKISCRVTYTRIQPRKTIMDRIRDLCRLLEQQIVDSFSLPPSFTLLFILFVLLLLPGSFCRRSTRYPRRLRRRNILVCTYIYTALYVRDAHRRGGCLTMLRRSTRSIV